MMKQDPCAGVGELATETFGNRGKCPVCKRELSTFEGRMRRHVPQLTQATRKYAWTRRMEAVHWASKPPGGPVAVLLRLWFRDYGGAQAFERFAIGVSEIPNPYDRPEGLEDLDPYDITKGKGY